MSIVLDGTAGITTPNVASTTSTLGPLTQALNLGSTGQIVFPATQNASANANTLDDYEEGTFTPTVSTAGYTLAGSAGFYTKIGRQINVVGYVAFSAVGASTSNAAFGGLPFTGANLETNVYYTGVCREDTVAGDIFVVQQQRGTANFGINSMDGVTAGSNQIFAINRAYSFSITYFV
jgi:hypothetical protein